MFWVFYRVGLVGIKASSRAKYNWAYELEPTLLVTDLSLDTRVRVHACFSRHSELNRITLMPTESNLNCSVEKIRIQWLDDSGPCEFYDVIRRFR